MMMTMVQHGNTKQHGIAKKLYIMHAVSTTDIATDHKYNQKYLYTDTNTQESPHIHISHCIKKTFIHYPNLQQIY